METGAIVCFVLAALSALSAVRNVLGQINQAESSVALAGYVVGAFMVPLVFLIGGLVLLKKSKDA